LREARIHTREANQPNRTGAATRPSPANLTSNSAAFSAERCGELNTTTAVAQPTTVFPSAANKIRRRTIAFSAPRNTGYELPQLVRYLYERTIIAKTDRLNLD